MFSYGECSVCHTEPLCFHEGGVAFGTQNPCVNCPKGGVAFATQNPCVFLREV